MPLSIVISLTTELSVSDILPVTQFACLALSAESV